MRVFFGIGLPSRAGREVKGFTESIKNELPRMKWVERENLHVTLKFLGDVDQSRIPSVSSAAREASNSVGKFEIVPGSLGTFPNPGRARVFWWGLEQGADECISLFDSLEQNLIEYGFDAERKRYHPHVTLARLRNPAPLPLESLDPPSGLSFIVDRFTLYKSTLTPQGPIYEIVEEFELGSR